MMFVKISLLAVVLVFHQAVNAEECDDAMREFNTMLFDTFANEEQPDCAKTGIFAGATIGSAEDVGAAIKEVYQGLGDEEKSQLDDCIQELLAHVYSKFTMPEQCQAKVDQYVEIWKSG